LGASLAARTGHKSEFFNSFVFLAIRYYRKAGKGSETEERTDEARAFEASHITAIIGWLPRSSHASRADFVAPGHRRLFTCCGSVARIVVDAN
jgi:hypothetical protein